MKEIQRLLKSLVENIDVILMVCGVILSVMGTLLVTVVVIGIIWGGIMTDDKGPYIKNMKIEDLKQIVRELNYKQCHCIDKE